MADLGWKEAVIRVLEASPEPMHYTDIAEAIADQQLRSEFGATPAASVNSIISMSIQGEKERSPFVRVDRGRYWMRSLFQGEQPSLVAVPQAVTEECSLINAFGMYWSRAAVAWISSPRILGQQQPGSEPVDFAKQNGVYLLHDGRAVVYVGRTTDQPLGARLRQHINDRLNGRWDRFSWFGVYPVTQEGSLNNQPIGSYDLTSLIVTMEALLIEGLEPPQNRKRGDDFRAVEFLQVEDPELKKNQLLRMMDELKSKL